jgi:hypothetical protein
MRARAAAAAAARRLSSSAQGSSGSSGINSNDGRPQETFFGFPPPGSDATTHFGFQTVAHELKEGLVAQVRRSWDGRRFHSAEGPRLLTCVLQVFHKVADKYDVMNDLMSGGLHRLLPIKFTRQIT